MPAKLSNAARHRKSLARHGTLIPKNWLPHFHEGPSLISMTITSRAPLRSRLRTDAPSNQRSPPSPTKSPASPVKNASLKRHPKLKPLTRINSASAPFTSCSLGPYKLSGKRHLENSRRRGPGISRPACRRNNSIHPQVFHQLPVVLPVVPQSQISNFKLWQRFFAVRALDQLSFVFLVDAAESLVQVDKGVLQQLHDLGFAVQRIEAVFDLRGDFFLPDRCRHRVIRSCHVLHHLAERPYTLEFSVRGRKREFILRHRVG